MTLPGNLLQRWTRWRNRWKAEPEQTYHYRHRRSLLRALDRAMHRARPVVAATYGEAFVTGALTAARQAFIALLPRVPYIRCRRNRLTWNLVSSAWVLALCRALAARGVSLSEAGRLLTGGSAAYPDALPAGLHPLRGRLEFTRPGQARRYAGDRV